MTIVQRKKQQVSFSHNRPDGFPEFLGLASIGGMEFCYFNQGEPFRDGVYEFELSTLTLPQGVSVVRPDATRGKALAEAFMMPVLLDLLPESAPPRFAPGEWHYCESEHSAARAGKFLCGNGILDEQSRQIVLHYDDSAAQIISKMADMPYNLATQELVPDPNGQYYLLPLLLPNQAICYYLISESEAHSSNLLNDWQRKLSQWLALIQQWQQEASPADPAPHFFVAGDSPLIFDDHLQMFFAVDVKMPEPPELVQWATRPGASKAA